MNRSKKILALCASWAKIQNAVEINRLSRGRYTAQAVKFNRGHFFFIVHHEFNQFPPWNTLFIAQAFIKNINGNFSGPATFFRGGGQCQCPLTKIGFRNKYSTFFPWETTAGWGINSSTYKGDRCGAIPTLKGATTPSQGGKPPPLGLSPSIPFMSLHFINLFQISITLQCYVTLSWNFTGSPVIGSLKFSENLRWVWPPWRA